LAANKWIRPTQLNNKRLFAIVFKWSSFARVENFSIRKKQLGLLIHLRVVPAALEVRLGGVNVEAAAGVVRVAAHHQPALEEATITTVYNTKGTRAHTHRELIRKWLWEPKGSSLESI